MTCLTRLGDEMQLTPWMDEREMMHRRCSNIDDRLPSEPAVTVLRDGRRDRAGWQRIAGKDRGFCLGFGPENC